MLKLALRSLPVRIIHPLLMLLLVCSSSCSTTQVDKDGRIIVHNFGYSSVTQPHPDSKPIYLSDASVVGVSSKDGITLGYKNKKFIKLNLDCRALIILSDDTQTARVNQLLKDSQLNQVCVAVNGAPPSINQDKTPLFSGNFGYSQIIQSPHFPADKQVVSIRDKVWGLSTGSENVVGYRSNQQIYVEEGCIGLILVETKKQFEAVKQSLVTLQGEGICLAMQDSQ